MSEGLINFDMCYGDILRKYLSKASPAYVIAPFIRVDVLKKLIDHPTDEVVITSWRADHLVSGFSSLELYNLCKENDWSLFVNNSLHAKIYSDSLIDCYLGSANVTDAALFSKNGNLECLTYIGDIGTRGRIEINKLISSSTLVDDRIYDQYLKWYQNLDLSGDLEKVDGPDIQDISPYYVSQLPATDDPFLLADCYENEDYYDYSMEHDVAVYGVMNFDSSRDRFLETLASNFFNHPFIRLFEERVKEGPIFFGEAKVWIQDNCVNVPLPHRKDLTELVHNLFYWFEALDPDHYEITVPGRHSECLRYNR